MIRNKFFEDPDGGYAKVGVKKNFDIASCKNLITGTFLPLPVFP